MRKGKTSSAEAAKIYGVNESSIHETATKEKEVHDSFAVAPQTAKVMATVPDACLVKMAKALCLWWRHERKMCSAGLQGFAPESDEPACTEASAGSPDSGEPKPLLQVRGGCTDSGRGFCFFSSHMGTRRRLSTII